MHVTFKNAIIRQPPKKKKPTLKQIFKNIKVKKTKKSKCKCGN